MPTRPTSVRKGLLRKDTVRSAAQAPPYSPLLLCSDARRYRDLSAAFGKAAVAISPDHVSVESVSRSACGLAWR